MFKKNNNWLFDFSRHTPHFHADLSISVQLNVGLNDEKMFSGGFDLRMDFIFLGWKIF